MKIAVACDHGGLNLKKAVIKYLTENDFALPAAEAVASGECDKGIIICSTGIGVSMVANKVPGVRCAHCHDSYCAEFTRRHNDANVLAMGEKVVGEGYALKIAEAFLTTAFEGGRHQRRVDKITAIEKKHCK